VFNEAGAAALGNTIAGGNTASGSSPDRGPDCHGAFQSNDYNLIQDPTGCNFTSGDTAHNLTGAAPRLGLLKNNGGPTPTMALHWDSPAIDAGNDALAPPTDQRGRPRVGVSDMGAFEV